MTRVFGYDLLDNRAYCYALKDSVTPFLKDDSNGLAWSRRVFYFIQTRTGDLTVRLRGLSSGFTGGTPLALFQEE